MYKEKDLFDKLDSYIYKYNEINRHVKFMRFFSYYSSTNQKLYMLIYGLIASSESECMFQGTKQELEKFLDKELKDGN